MDKESSEDDVWDDTILIKAYDNSVKLAKEELAKRIALSTNTIPDKSANTAVKTSTSKDSESIIFKVGDYVRATYEDEIDYEAKIIAISENGICKIKYIGYDNEQDVKICNLVPSWGKDYRRAQFSKAKQDISHDTQNSNKQRMRFSTHEIPPPPPMPPMLNDFNEDSEHISAMLMAWYMSGYYTGLYQGQKIAKSKNKT